jgi:organic hydroperoxide reductase OsmC/OhrA
MSVHPFPHLYRVASSCGETGAVDLSSDGLAPLAALAPVEFGGPGDHWSPETLLTAALASCFALSFRALATRRQIGFVSLRCALEGRLEREGGNSRFTAFTLRAHLQLRAGGDVDAARRALEHAKQGCLIANSLHATVQLESEVELAS